MRYILSIAILVLACVSCTENKSSSGAAQNAPDTNMTARPVAAAPPVATHAGLPDSAEKAHEEAINSDADEDLNKLYVLADSTMLLTSDIRRDHRIFGYAQPDTASKKLIFFSVFTDDVEHNPYNCPYGAYYQTSDLKEGMTLRFVRSEHGFICAQILQGKEPVSKVYFEQRWVEFVRE